MLSTPSKQLARRIVTEVEYEQRIEGYRLRERTGPLPMTMYSFEEVVHFFSKPYPQIDFIGLMDWIRMVMVDDELAQRINDIIKTEDSDIEKSLKIGELMAVRLIQCKKIV